MRSGRPHIAIVIANLPAERDRRVIRECLTLEDQGDEVTAISPPGRKGLRPLPGGSPNRWVFRMLVQMERLTLRTATTVFATNQSFVDNARARGIPADKLTVVRNGPKHDEIAAAGPDADGDDGVQRLVYVGVIGP